MNWRSRLAEARQEKTGKGSSNELTKLTEPPFVSFVSESPSHFTKKTAPPCEPPGSDDADMRGRLLRLAECDGRPLAEVHRLHAADVTACHGLSDDVLRAYLGLLERSEHIAAGRQPPELTKPPHCERCGPVWLHEGAPARVKGCAWCFRRKAGKAIPRPSVACGNCAQYKPNPINPTGGAGDCSIGLSARWPNARHICPGHSPTDGAQRNGR